MTEASTAYRIAVIAGDGVGPEVVRESVKVLDRISTIDPTIGFEFDHLDWGTERYLRTGSMMPADGLTLLRNYDAILLGAIGTPEVKDYITLRGLLLKIRFGLQHYINLRPIRLLPPVTSPLSAGTPSSIDMVFVREGSEGEYAGVGDIIARGTERETALQTAVFSRHGTERVVRWAFEFARDHGRTLTSVSKANALEYSGGLWDEVFDEIADEYPKVTTKRLLVDAAAMFMVREPERFEVVVASNLYADILTDLGAGIMGGMGLAPSASLNPERTAPSMFEPIHGSAPDIAGSNQANPIGSIWSISMMLDHLGYPEWAAAVLGSIEASLGSPVRTRDVGGNATTAEVGDAIVAHLKL
ncbi:MAG: 3-isopropylmalate dehydrogenase [Gemmatimonadota bacterium]|nr:3-isopropylmalate dehydrogenase [Gemmatimonadota bacterium]